LFYFFGILIDAGIIDSMDLEQLTKHQLVLLALLVSFITSIATGIVTVTLMDQAPPGVTNTINRVVERTVEVVSPDNQGAAVITKETTVVVKEEDLISDSIKKGSASLVRIRPDFSLGKNTNSETEAKILGVGILVSDGGLIATDPSVFVDYLYFEGILPNGKIFPLEIVKDGDTVAFAKLIPEEGKDISGAPKIKLAGGESLKLGQSVIAIGGKERDVVSTGIISSLVEEEVSRKLEDGGTATTTRTAFISTTLPQKPIFGTPLFNLFGELIGIYVEEYGPVRFIPTDILLSEKELLTKTQVQEETANQT